MGNGWARQVPKFLCRGKSRESDTAGINEAYFLQDINVSLFLVTVDRQNRDSRRRGERIPRYQKFLQVNRF